MIGRVARLFINHRLQYKKMVGDFAVNVVKLCNQSGYSHHCDSTGEPYVAAVVYYCVFQEITWFVLPWQLTISLLW